jgi:hypothetical protein
MTKLLKLVRQQAENVQDTITRIAAILNGVEQADQLGRARVAEATGKLGKIQDELLKLEDKLSA